MGFQLFKDQQDIALDLESYLEQFIIPQTHPYPEFVYWCANNYLPYKQVIM